MNQKKDSFQIPFAMWDKCNIPEIWDTKSPKKEKGHNRGDCNLLFSLVPRGGIEPPTQGFSVFTAEVIRCVMPNS
jgi:hypothetical protein